MPRRATTAGAGQHAEATQMTAVRRMMVVLAMALIRLSEGSYNDPVLFPLIEASGSATGDLVALGRWFSPSDSALMAVANTTAGTLQLMAGPTPHKAYCALEGLVFVEGATALAAGDIDGDGTEELIVVREPGVVVVKLMSGKSLNHSEAASTTAPAACNALTYHEFASTTTIDAATVVVLPFVSSRPQLLAVLRDKTTGTSDPPFAILRVSDGSIEVANRTHLGVAAREGWRWCAAATSSAGVVGDPMAAIGRISGDGSAVQVYTVGRSFQPIADATVSLGNASLLDLLIADIYGDGAAGLLVVERDTTLHYLFPGGSSGALADTIVAPPGGRAAMDAGRSWVGVAAGPWLVGPTVLEDEVQIVGLRAPDAAHSFSVSIVVHARPEHWMRRRASLANLRGTQEFKATYNDSARNVAGLTAPVDVKKVTDILTSTHTNTFLWSVCDCEPDWHVARSWGCSPLDNYNDFVRLLDSTRGFTVDGEQLRVWLGLNPPTEAVVPGATLRTGDCNVPTDSPLTPFNETDIFLGANYTSYDRWGTLVGQLASWAPHLVALDIDDFTSNIGPGHVFTGDNVAVITSNMRQHAPWVSLASVVYVEFTALPDLPYMLDAPVFFFRNAVEGAGPCAPASCVWGPHAREHAGSCLAGPCSEPTTFNLVSEVATLTSGMPPGRRIIIGYYATGHSSSGQPSPRYVSRLLQTAAVQPGVDGIMTYTMKAALAPCPAATAPLYGGDNAPPGGGLELDHQLGCIVKRAYGASSRANVSGF